MKVHPSDALPHCVPKIFTLALSYCVLPFSASGKMRICGSADFQTCKMRMVLRIFFADVTGKMRMWTQYYKLKKNIALR